MDSIEKWNKLCDYFERYKFDPEEKIQKVWETLFSEIFGYSLLDNEIESHRKIQLGSTERLIPDIIIKNNETDLFMVELKRENLIIDDSRKKQLYSYLKQEHNDLGILVCNQICLIKYDYSLPDDEQVCCCIDFKKNNPLGIKFIEIFEKRNFSKEKAIEFIMDSNKETEKIEKIKQQLTADLLKKLIIDFFSKEITEELLNQILDEYTIDIHRKEKKVISIETPNKKSFVSNTLYPKTVHNTSNDDIISSEINKIHIRVPKWLNNPDQNNSKILYSFLSLYNSDKKYVIYSDLEKKSQLGSKFKGNFDQMKNFGEKNHGKVFEQIGNQVYLG